MSLEKAEDAGSETALPQETAPFLGQSSLNNTSSLLHNELVSPAPSNWASRRPALLLSFFCAIMFLVYFDTGVFASNGVTGCSKDCQDPVGFPTAQGDFDLSKFQLGVLAAMFMVGLMLASVALTQLSSFVTPFRLIGLGIGIWTLAAVCSGLSQGFVSLLFARIFVGAGEASIITLSAPFIDDVAPKDFVSLWFAILSSAPPLGVALGYLFGGLAENIGWRACFFIEAAFGVPILLIALLAPDVSLKGFNNDDAPGSGKQDKMEKLRAGLDKLWSDCKVLHRHPVFICGMLANAPIQACVGAFTFWGPKMARELFHLSMDSANLALGALTIICALTGTLGGGALLDLMSATMRNALLLQLIAGIMGLVFCVLGLLLISNFWVFCFVFGIGLFGLFIATAPLYALGMWSLPAAQRPAGQAYLVVIMHALGDVPSPPIVGAIQGAVNNWRISMPIVVAYLLVSIALYSIALCFCKRAVDYREEYAEDIDEPDQLQQP